uniref:Protein kinase domain-containing protein n=1 Tax=Chromera velia CCMP2878 TaxID=1169474 RepID=A0A0G4G9U7_9ALVE|eukprot:Cvel_588.t1-p1 / transcript=Cvel_588.t1 / gene=Cvel_588 / organism=Chromera_velia_CCMP2878 / gene_product=Serine/threonine-protein phosphatase 6 regulatory, putative / transcript_product=Serine/threonine-protein phosphatase 6 regulatory, putative / location=Cvel_scaffold18:82099-88679(-) / protein_length=1369 / sequence_SO=supercontig / SO=protein_coding / is_pseudo=false
MLPIPGSVQERFFQALSGEDLNRIYALIRQGANVNGFHTQAGFSVVSALHHAVEKSSRAVVELLLREGANVHTRDAIGYSALHIAVGHKHGSRTEGIVRALLGGGADVNAKARFGGRTPLHMAACAGCSRKVLEILLAAGADVRAVDDAGASALDLAFRLPTLSEEVVGALVLGGSNLNTKNKSGESLVHIAVSHSALGVLATLVHAGANVKAVDNQGCAPLHIAINSQSGVMETLINAGADVDVRNKDGRSPLHAAASRCSRRKVEILVAAGAHVNAVDKDGNSPLHCVAAFKSAVPGDCEDLVDAVAKVLVKKGASAHAKNKKGDTPADVAERNGNPQLASKLRDPERCLRARGYVGAQVQTEREETVWSLEEIAALMQARLLHIRGGGGGEGGKGGEGFDGEGTWGLPRSQWDHLLAVLHDLSSPKSSLSPLLEDAKSALTALREGQARAKVFREHQKSLTKKVMSANREWAAEERALPFSEEEVRERDKQREECVRSLAGVLEKPVEVVESLKKLLEVGLGEGKEQHSQGLEVVEPSDSLLDLSSEPDSDGGGVRSLLGFRLFFFVHDLEGCLEGLRTFALDQNPRSLCLSAEPLSLAELAQRAASLADDWKEHRAEQLRAAQAAAEEAMRRVQATYVADLEGFSRACGELEGVEMERTALKRQMKELEDSFPLGEKRGGGVWEGKEVVTEIVAVGREVLKRLRSISEVKQELECGLREVTAALAEFRGGVSLAVSSSNALSEALTETLTRLLQEHGEEQEKEELMELELKVAQKRKREGEVVRLQTELQALRQTARSNDFPLAIARERARLLSVASLHFPELLWEGGEFLRLVRVDVQEVAQRGSLLHAGVLVQGRSVLRDFSHETVISEPSPQTGSHARVSEGTDRQGTCWILKRYEVGGGGASGGGGTAAARHFYRQVSMLHELQHPHLVPVTAVWQEGVYGYVQMPRYPGGDLAKWMAERPAGGGRDSRESLRLAEDILRALAFLHKRGKVHCDVKPQNVFLTEGGHGVLGDFDGVKEADPEPVGEQPPRQRHRVTTVVHVTAHYLAPEVLGGGRLTAACDIFSAGVLLSELLGEGVLAEEADKSAMFEKLVRRMRSPSPLDRPTAAEALQDPLFSRESAETAQCVACFEILLRDRGVSCTDRARHFLCAECLNRQMDAHTRIDAEYSDVRARFKAAGSKVSCCASGCPSDAYPHTELSRHLQPDIHSQWEAARQEAAEERLRAEMETEYEQRLQRALMEDGAQRRVREIVEEVLTLKCPRCRSAFLDFRGCVALTCARCSCGFCGYCLQDCGADAHAHVPQCPLGEGMFVCVRRWKELQRQRQRAKLEEVVGRLGTEERAEVLRLLRPLLDERGFQMEGQ